jgi:hypothetical protein
VFSRFKEGRQLQIAEMDQGSGSHQSETAAVSLTLGRTMETDWMHEYARRLTLVACRARVALA